MTLLFPGIITPCNMRKFVVLLRLTGLWGVGLLAVKSFKSTFGPDHNIISICGEMFYKDWVKNRD